MKRCLFSMLAGLMSMGVLATAARATQISLSDSRADLNDDGNFSLHEVVTYNRDQRNKR